MLPAWPPSMLKARLLYWSSRSTRRLTVASCSPYAPVHSLQFTPVSSPPTHNDVHGTPDVSRAIASSLPNFTLVPHRAVLTPPCGQRVDRISHAGQHVFLEVQSAQIVSSASH